MVLGKKTSKLFVGSHNATFAGFGGNAEITTAVTVTGTKFSEVSPLFAEAFQAVRAWIAEGPSRAGAEIAALAEAKTSCIRGPQKGPQKPNMTLLWSGRGRPALWEQLRPHLPLRAHQVIVGGPFFDRQLSFLSALARDVKPAELLVGIDPSSVVLNTAMAARHVARFVDIRGLLSDVGFSDSSGLHAKLILFRHASGEVLVSGSANPSSAAWLKADTNAEVITIQRGLSPDELALLGIDRLDGAPPITPGQWEGIRSRIQAESTLEEPEAVARGLRVVTAVEDGGRLEVHGLRADPAQVFLLFGGERNARDVFWRMQDGALCITGEDATDLAQCCFVEIRGPDPAFAVVDHLNSLLPSKTTGSVQGELRAALSGLSEDAARLDEVMRIVAKAIFDEEIGPLSDEQPAPTAHVGAAGPRDDARPLGPRVARLDDVRRRHKAPRALATGNIAIVIDLLIRRISEGLPGTSPAAADLDGDEDSEIDPILEAAHAASPTIDGWALLKAFHRKMRKLGDRMISRLEQVWESQQGAVTVIVQLAAVLGLIRYVRRYERDMPWVPFGESLLRDETRAHFFWWIATYIAGPKRSIALRAQEELRGEPVEELSIALGLSMWLGWETGTDVRELPEHPDEEQLWDAHWAAILLRLSRLVAEDERAVAIVREALNDGRSGRRDRWDWLAAHLRLGEALAFAEANPEALPTMARAVRRGDMVRVKMPSGIVTVDFVVEIEDTKVRLADPEHEEGRPVMKSFVAPVDTARLLG